MRRNTDRVILHYCLSHDSMSDWYVREKYAEIIAASVDGLHTNEMEWCQYYVILDSEVATFYRLKEE